MSVEPSVERPEFELLFNTCPGLYLVLDPQFQIVAVTDSYLEATKTVRNNILGQNIFDVFPDDPNEEATGVRNLRASLEYVRANRVADTMAVQRYPIRVTEGDQERFELRYWSPTNSPVRSPTDGTLKYIIHRVEDVTEYIQSVGQPSDTTALLMRDRMQRTEAEIFARAQEIQQANQQLKVAHAELRRLNELLEQRSAEREEMLKSSDERFRLLVDGVREYAIFMLDPHGTIISWNQGAERIYGYDESEALGQNYDIFFTQADRVAGVPIKEITTAIQHGSADEQGWRLRKDGKQFWASGVLTALLDEAGRVRGFARISRDMTKSRRAETLLRSIVDTAIDGIITIDAAGVIRTFNKAAQDMFGYEAAEVIGRKIDMLMPEPYHSQHDQYIGNYLRTGDAKIIGVGREVEGLRKNGKRFPIDLAISEFHHDDQLGFTGLVRDITERKELERQYRHSQKMQAVGTLAGGIAHDFNNLLTVIIGYCELLTSHLPGDSSEAHLVGEVHHAGTRAALLTRQLLTFSRQQANRPVTVDLNCVVKDCARMLERLISEDIHLETQAPPQPCFIRADPSQMEQVIFNLAINARDAMPQGGNLTIATSILSAQDAQPGDVPLDCVSKDLVLLQVTDDGEGIEPEIQSRIFEPFFTTKGVGKGTGLGLSVVDGIVRQAGGCLRLTSESGKGTSFSIYFPLVELDSESPATKSGDRVVTGTETILLAEDDPAVRDYTCRALEACGYRVITARDSFDALRLVRQSDLKIDLLLTDVVMPDTSGFQLIEEVKRIQPNMQFLLVSGYAGEDIALKQFSDIEHPMLEKPFTIESLSSAVRNALDR